MNFIGHILRFRIIGALAFFREMDAERRIRTIVGFAVLTLFFFGALFFFRYLFDYLSKIRDIGVLLMDRIISLGFLAIFLMLVISNAITAISTLYRSGETADLFSRPLPRRQLFVARFLDNLFYSTWGVLVLGVPIILAYGIVRGFSWWGYLYAFCFILLPFTVIPACLGAAAIIFVYLASGRLKPRTVVLAMAALLSLAIVIYLNIGQTSTLSKNILGDWRVLNSFLGSLSATSFPFMPHFWVGQALRQLAGQPGIDLFLYTFGLLSTMLMSMRLLFRIAEKYYYGSWQNSYGHAAAPKKTARKFSLPSFFGLPEWLPADFRSVLTKDLRLFIREPAQWAQFLILLVLLIIYLINLRHFPGNMTDKFWRTIISFANFAFTGFILATLAVRFVYPNISLEGRAFWAIASSPMPIRRLFWEKFFSAFIIFALLAEILAFISNIMLGLTGYMMILSFFSILLMSVALTSLSVGMGAVFPRFDERNPGRIASSMGGTITTVISLVYVCLAVIIMAMPAYRYSVYTIDGTIEFPAREFILSGILLLLLNTAAIAIPIKIGLKSISERDF